MIHFVNILHLHFLENVRGWPKYLIYDPIQNQSHHWAKDSEQVSWSKLCLSSHRVSNFPQSDQTRSFYDSRYKSFFLKIKFWCISIYFTILAALWFQRLFNSNVMLIVSFKLISSLCISANVFSNKKKQYLSEIQRDFLTNPSPKKFQAIPRVRSIYFSLYKSFFFIFFLNGYTVFKETNLSKPKPKEPKSK